MVEKIWSFEYEYGGKRYAVQMLATELEAITHAENLGLGEPEALCASNVPYDIEIVEEGTMQ